MAEYIEKQAAIDTILGQPPDAHYPDWYASQVKALPAADVVPVRLGEWLDGYKMQTCSLCKCRGKKSWTFCPHCGARMIYGKREE